MSLAPSYPSLIPFPAYSGNHEPSRAHSTESATVVVSELVEFARRLDLRARTEGARVSAASLVAKAFLVASLRHPAVDARWPLLPTRHGLALRELTAALDGAESASPLPDDAAVLSVGAIERTGSDDTVSVSLAFDPRRIDAVEAHRLLDEFAALLADPWELIASA